MNLYQMQARRPASGWWRRPAGMSVECWKASLVQANQDARRNSEEQHRLALLALRENAAVVRIHGAKVRPAPKPASKPSKPTSKPASKPTYPKPSTPTPWARATPRLDRAAAQVRRLLESAALVVRDVRDERNRIVGKSYWTGGTAEPIFIPTAAHDRSQRIAALASAARGPDKFAGAGCYRDWAV